MYKTITLLSVLILCLSSKASAQTSLCHSLNLAKGITGKLRQLKFKSEVSCLSVSTEEMRKKTEQDFFREISQEQIKYEEIIYKALNIIPANYNYKNEIIKIYANTAAGL